MMEIKLQKHPYQVAGQVVPPMDQANIFNFLTEENVNA